MKTFNYSAIRQQKWDSDVLGLIAAVLCLGFIVYMLVKPYKEATKLKV